MNKTQLVEQVAKKTGLSKAAARQAVDAVFGSISEALAKRKREPVTIAGFGAFRIRRSKKRLARNPRTGEIVEVPARNVPVFRPAQALKDAVNK